MKHVDIKVEKVAMAAPSPVPGGLPNPVINVAKYWCSKANGSAHGSSGCNTPRWGEFKMGDLGDAMAHVTILHKMEDGRFAFEFCGSAVAAIFGQDLTGETVTAFDGTMAEIDWAERVRPVLRDGECHLQKGVADPQYTSPIDFIALDMPLRNPDNNEIGYIVGCTAPDI